MIQSRFLILLIPVIILLLLESFLIKPKIFYLALVLSVFLIFFTVRQFTKASLISKQWWNFIILPAFFTISLALYSTMISHKIFIQFLFFLNTLFIYYYLKNIYYYLLYPGFYKSQSLENMSAYGNFLVIFFSFSAIYSLQSFLNIPIWLLMIAALLISALVIYHVLWINKINFKDSLIFILICALLLIEMAWAITFLPLNYNAVGLVIAVCYYMLIGLIRFYLRGQISKKIIKLYLSLGFVSIFIILLTSRWI